MKRIEHYSQLIPAVSNQVDNASVKTAYIPVSTGCNQFCSYCIVPFTRGLEIHRSVDEIIREVLYWIKEGKQEIVLL